jgi:hypothetical protein
MYDSHRRLFLKSLMLGAGSAALHPVLTESTAQAAEQQGLPQAVVPENMLGEYGPWAKKMLGDGPAKLPFLRDEFSRAGIGAWREKARARLLDCMAMPDSGGIPKAEVVNRVEFDGLSIEHQMKPLQFHSRDSKYFPYRP